MAVEPLSWPESVRHPNRLQKFLMGFPRFGPDRRAYREFRRTVADRPEDCLTLWKQDEQTLGVREALIDILREAVSWKSRKFIPADPCEILFWDPLEGIDFLDAAFRIEKHFGIKLDTDRKSQMIAMTFGELVDAIVDKRWEAPPEEMPARKTRADKLGCAVILIFLVMAAALIVLSTGSVDAWFGPVAIYWACQVSGILGLVNTVLGIVVWARSEKEGSGYWIATTLASFLLGLFFLLIANVPN